MGTKVKGFFKGLKNNISNIFDEEQEEQEIQIGMPTDVKHVAHIGADRPVAESPSWMKEFDDGSDPNSVESPGIKKGNHRASRSEELNPPDMPNPTRHRHHASDTALDPGSELDLSTKPKRRRHRLRRRSQEKPEESLDAKVPDAPRKRNRRRRRRDDGSSTNSMDGGESSNNETQS